MKYIWEKGGFTLAELIVVITIVVILSTIAFVSFSGYTSKSRDTVRMSDIENINTTLNVFHAYDGWYPSPTSAVDITLSGAVVWTQGVFGSWTTRETGKIFWDLRDPLFGNNYSYSVTSSKREYQLSYILEQSNSFWQSLRNKITYDMPSLHIPETYASYSAYDPSLLDPVIWLDGMDIDGDDDNTDNPPSGTAMTSWTNKWTRWDSGDATVTTGTVSYLDNALNGFTAVFVPKDAGLEFTNSAIDQGEIYYVLHDSWGKVSWMAMQGTSKNYIIGAYDNYRNSLRIGGAPNHLTKSPAIKNSLRRKPFFYSYVTDGTNYEFRNSSNLISLWATNSIDGVTWAINKAGYYTKTNQLADWGIGEVLIFDTTLSDDDRFDVEWYLAHKWWLQGLLDSSHPYVTTPPTSSTSSTSWWGETPPSEPPEIQDFPDAPVFVSGNYNKLFTHGITPWGNHMVFTTPSIIASDLSSPDFLDIVENQKLVYEWYANIPAAYEWEEFTSTGGLDFNIISPIAFSWSKFDLAAYSGIKEIDAVMRASYEYSPFYKDVADNFDSYGTYYVESILWEVIGINPIKPYFCSEILDRKFIYNIASEAEIDASPTNQNSGISGTGWLNNEIKSTEWNLNTEYQTDTLWGYVELLWDSEQPIGFIRLYNSVWIEASYLSGATISLYERDEVEPIYSHPIWDTGTDYIVDLDLEGIGELHEVDRIRIEAAPDQKISLREIEVYIGWNISDGYYTVDSDGIGWQEPYKVYCDMATDGWGWTRVGEDFIGRSYFDDLKDPQNFTGYFAVGNKNNIWENTLRSDIIPPSSIPFAEVLRHSGDEDSYYELYFDNIPNIEFTTEIRLSAWVYGTQKSPFYYIIDYEGSSPTAFVPDEDTSVSATEWRYETIRIPIDDVLEDFSWHIGRDVDASSTPIDITGISMELYYK